MPRTRMKQWLLLAIVLASTNSLVRAQDPPAPTNADLIRRLKELEATVQELKANQVAPAPVLAPPPLDPVPSAPAVPARAPSAAPVQPVQYQIPTTGDGQDVIPFVVMPGVSATPEGQGRPTRLEQNRSGEIQPVPAPGGLPPGVVAGWGNGFYIQSPDQKFVAYITGQAQTDSRWFMNNHDTTDVDEFILRRARLGLEAIMFDFYEFRILADFGGSNLNSPAANSTPTPSIVDSYGNVHYFDAFQVLGGRFKQPFSYEQLIIDRSTPFMERSLIDQLVPQRDVGVMIHGQNLLNGRFEYYFSLSNGEINGNFDLNNSKDFVSRFVIHPFAPNESSFFRYLTFGVSTSFGQERQTPVQVSASSSNPQVLRTPLGVPWLNFKSTDTANGDRTRVSPEVQFFRGPFALASQYYVQNQEFSPAATGAAARRQINVMFHGYYVMGTMFLTGEERQGYSRGVEPVRAFDLRSPLTNPGAWELAARISQLHVSDNIFLPGTSNLASATANANGTTEMTLGVNWYLNRGMLMRFNWERDWFNRPVTLGPGPQGRLSLQDALGARFELAF